MRTHEVAGDEGGRGEGTRGKTPAKLRHLLLLILDARQPSQQQHAYALTHLTHNTVTRTDTMVYVFEPTRLVLLIRTSS